MRVSTLLCLALAASAVAIAVADDAVTVLDASNFDQLVGGDLPAFVEFYAPWCGHCKQLAPEYEKVAEAIKPSDGVLVAKVDADAEKALGSRFGVSGFPTLKWFPKGSLTPEDYNGGRTAADIVSFINSKAGTNKKIKEAPTAVTVLTPDNFDKIVMDPTKDVLVEFYAPWCGHCKSLAPIYEKVAATYAGEPNVVVAKLDSDAHRETASRFGVTGYPTLKFFPKGSADKSAEDYTAGREGPDFVTFLNNASGAKRVLGGKLTPDAGRLADFDDYAKQFVAAGANKAAVLKDAKASLSILTKEELESANVYIKTMEKIIEKGASYAAKEAKRLNGMIDSDVVSASKKTAFMVKANILAAFL